MTGIQGFREALPHFTEERFPDGRVAFYLAVAGKRLNPGLWGDLLEEGRYLYAAHYLTLEAEADKAGGLAAAAGPVTSESKSVGGVSVSEGRSGSVIAAMAAEGAGSYADTIWGRQYWDLLRIVGAGGLQV